MPNKIILVEDEASIADTIIYALEIEGYEVTWFTTGQEALDVVEGKQLVHFMILDVGLPDMSGFDLCRKIRTFSDVPLLFLTARGEEVDRVVGLELGADDYMVKPFSPRELVARVRANLRRVTAVIPQETHNEMMVLKDFSLSVKSHTISFKGVELELSRYEYLILALLLSHPKRVYARDEIMEQVWDEPEVSLDRTIDTHIKTIRSKIRAIDPEANPIETRRGFGYVFAG